MVATQRNSSALRGADEDSGSDDRSHEPVARDSFYSKGKRDNVEKTLEDVLSFALRDVLSKDDGPLEKIVETVTAKIAAMDDESVAESINGIPRTASESRIPVGDLPLGYNDRGQSAAENELSDAQYLVGSAYLLRGKSQGGFQRVNSANRVGAGSNAKYHTTPNVRVSKICGAHSTILNTRVDDCTNLVLSAEFLMDNGAAAFFPPVADYPRALKHWRRALETADRACAPILKAKILSNVSCALSSIRREEEALVLMKVAWTLTLSYIRSVPNHRESYWMDFMRTILNIDSQAAAHMGPFVCRVDCGSHGGIVSMLTVPDKHASGALIVTWVLQLAINMGNRYYKLNNIENASKYYILTKILSECVIEDILSSGPTRNSSKSDLRSAFFLPRPLSHQIYSPILSSNRSKIKHSPPSPLKLRQTFSLGPTGLQYKNGTHSRVKLNYIIFQALLCNAKSLSYLGVCYSCSPSLKSRSLPLHLEAENRIMRLLSLTSIELNENSSESPPLALIESKFACSCILLNLNLAYREEGKLNLATVYSDLSLKTYHDYVNLLTSFYSSVKISAPNQEPQK